MISNVNNQQPSLNGYEVDAIATTSDSSVSPTLTKNSFSNDGASNFKSFFTKSPMSLSTNTKEVVNGSYYELTQNLHNYSKVPGQELNDSNNNTQNDKNNNEHKEMVTTNNSSPEDSNDAPEIKTPDHHARRPMNAFLIFCKRHRGLVREKYPNLENRSITKILGDWWAFLTNEQKTCYTNLAKQFKDAFFTANPNFKWYKLPAPPLRTISTTRPDAAIVTHQFNGENFETFHDLLPKDRLSRTNVDFRELNEAAAFPRNGVVTGKNGKILKKHTNVGVFKFADEAHMGGLSSLMQPERRFKFDVNGPANYEESDCSMEVLNQRNALQDALNDAKQSIHENLRPGEQHSFPINFRRVNGHDEPYESPVKKKLLFDDDLDGKSTRACKGKRYQTFMSSANKKTKTRQPIGFPHNGYCKVEVAPKSSEELKVGDSSDIRVAEHVPVVQARAEDVNDFNLDDKIKKLPALDLEEYLVRKKESKKKKKINNKSKGRVHNAAKKVPTDKPAVVGSQKRKARKESITRRDVALVTQLVDGVIEEHGINEVVISDYMGLATLAAVAANEFPINK